MPHTILHADMDAFFAAVEQRDRPELRGRPVVVGGLSDRGVVSTASYEARVFGVGSAMPMLEARTRCPDAVFLPGNMKRYVEVSRTIFSIFERFSPLVEGLSLDEAFLDLSGTQRLLGTPAQVGQQLRKAVREETGLAISVGIAPVKMVAKIASDEAKPDGLVEVQAHEVRDFLGALPVGRLWGVGPVGRQRLERAGYRKVSQLAEAHEETLRRVLGDWGVGLARLARGEDERGVESSRVASSYGEENTFAQDVSDLEPLERAIRRHAEAVARRLRKDEKLGRVVVLKLKLGRRRSSGPRGYPQHTRQCILPAYSDDGSTLAQAAQALLREFGCEEPFRLIGVTVRDVVTRCEAEQGQLGLFDSLPDTPESEEGIAAARRSQLNTAVDELTSRFGKGAVSWAGEALLEPAGLHDRAKSGETEN
jgi:DNA polymerase-4